jgi:preprotein translocase subunit SecE
MVSAMEDHYQKWVNLCYLVLSISVGYLLFTAGGKLVGAYDLETKIRNIDLILRGLSTFSGVVLFVSLYRHRVVNQFMNEVVLELSRVHWPSARETRVSTFVVVLMVLISGMILGLLDYLWVQVVRWML